MTFCIASVLGRRRVEMPFLTSPGITSAAGRTFGPIITYPSLKHTATVIMLHGLGELFSSRSSNAPCVGQ